MNRCVCKARGPHLLSQRVLHALESEHDSLRTDEAEDNESTSSTVSKFAQIEPSADLGKDDKSRTSSSPDIVAFSISALCKNTFRTLIGYIKQARGTFALCCVGLCQRLRLEPTFPV